METFKDSVLGSNNEQLQLVKKPKKIAKTDFVFLK